MKHPELLTFTQATLYFPLILIAILFLPTLLSVTGISAARFGGRVWARNTLENPAYFILPIFTSLSFFGESKATSPEHINFQIGQKPENPVIRIEIEDIEILSNENEIVHDRTEIGETSFPASQTKRCKTRNIAEAYGALSTP